MKRRDLIALLGVAAGGWPSSAAAQQSGSMRKLGVLLPDQVLIRRAYAGLIAALETKGWTPGNNLRLDERWTPGVTSALYTRDAASLVRDAPDAIFTYSYPIVSALHAATTTIPIVFAYGVTDPVGNGFVKSLAHPGGNITGFTMADHGSGGKMLQLLSEAAPRMNRVLWMWNPDSNGPVPRPVFDQAKALGLNLKIAMVRTFADLDTAVRAFAVKPGGGVLIPASNFGVAHREAIVRLVLRYRLPSIGSGPSYAAGGGLLTYGGNVSEIFRQSASYVDRVLRGEKPSDLPVQNPTKYIITVNLTTAKALGLTLPPSLLVQADQLFR